METSTIEFISLEDAKKKMQQQLIPINDSMQISLSEAVGRVISHPIYANLNIPAFNNAAMDGYAIRCRDVVLFKVMPVVGKSFPGNSFNGEWPIGSTIRIMTGAPIPIGCDAVIMQEKVKRHRDGIIITTPIYQGQNIRYIGEDIQNGTQVLNTGTYLDTCELSLLASLGITKVNVFRKLRVAIFSTGNELQEVGHPLIKGKIYDINRFAIKLMLNKLICEIIDLGIISDDEDVIFQTFNKANKLADVVISTGGVSVGEEDFIKKTLEKLGIINFWKIAIKPGKPFAFGRLLNSWFCGLPGNPVSAVVVFYHIVQPFLNQLTGQTKNSMPLRQHARAMQFLKKSPGRVDFQRGILNIASDGILEVHSTGSQDSHIFSSFTLADCFIVLEHDRGNVHPGEWVEIEKFNGLLKR